MNPKSSKDRQRLGDAMRYHYRQNEHHRRGRAKLIREFAGTGYGQNMVYGLAPEIYVNLIQQTVEAYSAAYAFNEPQFLMGTFTQAHKSFAERFRVAVNNYSRRIFLRNTIEECIQDAFFSLGIAKVYLEDCPEIYAETDPTMDPGMPWVGRVSFDNFVFDGSAEVLRRCAFVGDRYRMNLADARGNPAFSKGAREKLKHRPLAARSYDGGTASEVSEGNRNEQGSMEDGVDLIDVFLSREQLICTWPCNEDFSIPDVHPLAVREWDGVDTGPYRYLKFMDVPDNVMPTAPGQALRPLFLLFNNLMRKLSSRARSQKDIPYFLPGSEDDMQKALSTADMQPISVNAPDAINVLKLGGIDQSLSSFNYGVFELFKSASGNLDYMAGLGPSSDTLGQDQMIAQQANTRVALSRQKVNHFVSEIGRDIAWLMFDDPVLTISGKRSPEGLPDYTIDASWYPPDQMPREGEFEDYNIWVEPYSMQYTSPGEKLQRLRQTVQTLGPMMPMFQAAGVQFDVRKYLKLEAELQNFPELLDIFTSITPQPAVPGAGSESAGGAAGKPNGEYTRTNVSQGPTNSGSMNMAFTQQGSGNGQASTVPNPAG